ncbi:MAG: hypothetical protein O7G87_18285 [bacterium]|nr:hypothetical protein [bacterium]
MTEIEKVAVLLIALGPEHAQRILDKLSTADLLPIIQAMKHMRRIDPEIRQNVLKEVNDILTGLAAQNIPGAQKSPRRSDSPSEPLPPTEETPLPLPEEDTHLFERLGPHLPERIDPDHIDWGGAGFDFGEGADRPPRGKRPPEDSR